jgi:hypothetical protein
VTKRIGKTIEAGATKETREMKEAGNEKRTRQRKMSADITSFLSHFS